jgi:YggT family protein
MTGLVLLAIRLLNLYSLVLLGRFVLDYVRMFSRSWRPSGIILVLVEAIYSLTDPVLRTLRKVLPPLRLGTIALDLSYIVAYLAIGVLRNVLWGLVG